MNRSQTFDHITAHLSRGGPVIWNNTHQSDLMSGERIERSSVRAAHINLIVGDLLNNAYEFWCMMAIHDEHSPVHVVYFIDPTFVSHVHEILASYNDKTPLVTQLHNRLQIATDYSPMFHEIVAGDM